MVGRAVTDYQADWDINKNKGNIKIKLQGRNKIINLKISNAAEYLAVLTMLQGPKNVYARSPKILYTKNNII